MNKKNYFRNIDRKVTDLKISLDLKKSDCEDNFITFILANQIDNTEICVTVQK